MWRWCLHDFRVIIRKDGKRVRLVPLPERRLVEALARSTAMTKALVPAIVAMLTLGGGTYAAAEGTWCFREPGAGVRNCGFHSFAQCRASWAGGSSYCAPNPAFAGAGRQAPSPPVRDWRR
jgi:Protein of unknown function (DUF3551)